MSTAPVFGKRNAARPAHRLARIAAAPTVAAQPDHAAFFAAVRAELEEPTDTSPVVVPLSFKAAFLAGLVVGCGLVGFDLTGSEGASGFTRLTSAMGVHIEIGGSLVPAMMLLGLLGAARAIALNLIVVHGLLRLAKQTSRAAYALGGAAAALALATVLFALFDHAPAHGWIVEALAGAAGALLYRVLAGTKPA